MPGPRSKLTLASALRQTAGDLPGTLAVQYVCDGIKHCLDNPSVGWPAAVAAVAGASINPISVAGLVGLGVALGVKRFRHKQKEARQLEAKLRKQAAEHESMHDILLALQDGSLTVGLDELALNDLREIVSEVFNGQSEKLNDTLEAAFAEQFDELQSHITTEHQLTRDATERAVEADGAKTRAELNELKQLILAQQPGHTPIDSPGESDNTVLEAALVRLAKDAEQGVEAARRALQDKSPLEAGDYFNEKLAALDDAKQQVAQRIAEEEVQLSREAAEVLYRTGRIADAEQALERILNHLPDDLDALNRLGHIARLRGQLDEAEKYYRQVFSLSSEDLSWQAVALGNLGIIAEIRGDLDEAEKLYNQALDIDRQLGRLIGQANSLGNLGIIAEIRGDLDEAEKFLNQALDINRQLGRLEGQAIALGNLGNIAQTRGDLDQAEKFLNQALDINRQLGRLEGQAIQLGNLGNIAKTRGELDEAEKLYHESLDINRQLGSLEGQAIQLGNLGNIALTRGDLDEAEKLYNQALDIDRQLGRLEGQANQLGNLGNIAKTRGDLDEAEQFLNQALDINRQLGSLKGQASDLGNLGVVAELRNDRETARALWIESRDLYQRVGMPHRVKQLQGGLDGLDAEGDG